MSGGRQRAGRSPGLAARLVLAQLLVLLAGVVVLAAVAYTVGPPLFRAHLHRAIGTVSPQLTQHLVSAFLRAGGISVAIGTAAFVIAAIASGVLITRRLSRPIRDLAHAASRLAAGDHAVRLAPTGLGVEFDAVTDAFNTMADALESTEGTRRRLLADVAHELRTPLATIKAHLEGIEDGVRACDTDTLAVLHAQTVRMQRLVEDISLVSRAEEHQLPLNRAVVPVAAIVEPAAAACLPAYQAKGVGLRVEANPGIPPVEVDRDRMTQVLVNLLTNALRHTPAEGTVTVSAAADDGVQITVADTGEGIAPEHLSHVFERFYRADPARDRTHGGSGIGLAIARALVQAHDGTITAESRGPGAGAVFRISLPATSGLR